MAQRSRESEKTSLDLFYNMSIFFFLLLFGVQTCQVSVAVSLDVESVPA